ncbi:MAG: DNA polymerase IV [Flavobacteriales bacterium]
MERIVAHIDLDAFFVSVERLRDPKLEGYPLIIGGGGERGVVACCSYEARRFGVHSAMPMKMALRLCPDAKVIQGDMDAYSRFSSLVTEMIAEQAPLYEKASIDEFYLDMTGMDRFFACQKWIRELRERIIKESGLPLSFGMSVNKMVSKMATDEAKPNGQLRVPTGNEDAFIAPMQVKRIPMVGDRTFRSLTSMGVRSVGKLAELPPEYLEREFGKRGPELWRKANGIDPTPVVPYSERKSISAERTFPADRTDLEGPSALLVRMTEELSYELRRQSKCCSCITVKLRYSDHQTVSKQQRIPYTSADHVLLPKVKRLFEQLFERRVRIRAVGVSLSGLVQGGHQIDLLEDSERMIGLYAAMDRIRDRFGKAAIGRALKNG